MIRILILAALLSGCARHPHNAKIDAINAEIARMYPDSPAAKAAREKCLGGDIRGGTASSRQITRELAGLRRDLCFRERAREREVEKAKFEADLEYVKKYGRIPDGY